MRFNITGSILFLLFILACQSTVGRKNSGNISDCVDTNGNGICDSKDSDGDGLLDEKEKVIGTNPNSQDTDKDGSDDLCEVQSGTDPKNPANKPDKCSTQTVEEPTTGNDNLDLMCKLYANQVDQNTFLYDNYKVTTECKDIDIKDADGKVVNKRKVCKTDYSGGNDPKNAIGATNYGDIDATDKVTLTIKVKWGVSYKDVIIISNGTIALKPWFKYWTRIEEEDDSWFEDDNNTWDHHLGDMPSLSDYCDNSIKGLAIVTVNDIPYSWFQPAFLPFKISEYANAYPFATDAVSLVNDNDKDGIEYMGGSYNNFKYQTHLISVSVDDESSSKAFKSKFQMEKNVADGKNLVLEAGLILTGAAILADKLIPALNSSEVASDDKEANSGCKTREVTFKYEFFKEKPKEGEPLELDFKELQNKCEDFLDQ